MASMIAVVYVRDDGSQDEFFVDPGSRLHREALEHEAAGCCVIITEIELCDPEPYSAM